MLQTTIRDDWIESRYMKSNSLNSKKMAEDFLKLFDLFLKEKSKTEEQIIKKLKKENGEPEFYLFLNSFVQFMNKQGKSRNTIDIRFAFLKSYLRFQGIRIYREDVNQFVTLPKRITELKPPLTVNIIRTLVDNCSEEMRALLLTLASSGLRISEALQLKLKDVNLESKPVILKIRAETTKTKQERKAFISTEAVRYLKPLLSIKKENDFIFCEVFNHNTLVRKETSFNNLRKKVGITSKYANGKRYHVNIHAFRAFFHTQATKVLGGDIAHALIGHRKYLDQYFRLDEKEQCDLYKKLEPYITIYNDQKAQIENKLLHEQMKNHDLLEKRLAEAEAKILRLQKVKVSQASH